MTNSKSRTSWRAAMFESRKWKKLVYENCILLRPIEPLTKAKLVLTRFSSSEPDFDGLVSGFKHCIDGLKEAKVILDDKPSIVGQPQFFWHKSKKGMGSIKIEVYEDI